MLRSRCKSVDFPLQDAEDGVVSSYKWKTNLLCGVYKQELSSSVYFPSIKDSDDKNSHEDILKKKKYSFMVIKHSLMRLKTTKQEVYFLKDSPPSTQHVNYSSCASSVPTPRSACEKIKKVDSAETDRVDDVPGGSEFQATENFQTSQSKQFVRNYLKTKTGSTGELAPPPSGEKPDEARRDINGNVPDTGEGAGEELGAEEEEDAVLFLAVAVRDCIPSPYDTEALAFRKGATIQVTSTSVGGLWRGRCGGREGSFKFVDVQLQSALRRNTRALRSQLSAGAGAKSRSVSDLLAAIHMENLTSVFVLNGYDTAEDIKHLSVDDLDYLGIDDSTRDTILQSVNKLNHNTLHRLGSRKLSGKLRDSGFNSSDSDLSTPSGSIFLPKETC